MIWILMAFTACMLGAAWPADAQDDSRAAQDAPVPQQDIVTVDTVTVSARLREEDSSEVPFALTVLDRQALATRRIDDAQSLFRQVPGLSLTSFDDGRFAYFQLRGIGPLSQAIGPDDGSVVTYIDGVPQPVYASEFAYLDLARIEVLRGPQGTLFGRNAQGGAINLITRQPGPDREAGLRLEIGQDGHALAQLSGSGPLLDDRLAGSISARVSSADGYIRNIAPGGNELGDRDVRAVRGSLVYTPTEETGALYTLTANGDRQVSTPYYYVLRGQPRREVELNPENRVRRTTGGLSLKAEIPLDFADLVSISAYNAFDNHQITDDTDGLIYGPLFGLPSSVFLPPLSFSDWEEKERRFYQELRLSSVPDIAVAWTVGANYFQSDFDVQLDNRSTFSPFLNGNRDATQKIDSHALFGELTAPLGNPRLKGTLGLRYTHDAKSLRADFVGIGFPGTVARFSERDRADYTLLTGRAALAWEATDDVNIYATVGRGAKSGGFPRFTLSAAIGVASQPYAESTSLTYEAGLKARILGGRGRINVAGFYNDVSDEQLFVLDFVSFQFLPVNLDTRSFGVELQGGLELGRGWTLAGGLSWTDGEIREADARSGAQSGNRIPNVTELGSTLTLDYQGQPVSWAARSMRPMLTLTHQYVGTRAADVGNNFDLPEYHNVDVRLGMRVERTEVYVFSSNLLNEERAINGVLYGPGVEGVSYARDGVFGIGLSTTF